MFPHPSGLPCPSASAFTWWHLLSIPGLFSFSFQDSQRSELLETFHKLTIPEPGTSVHLGVVSVGGDVNPRCLIFIPCHSRGMSKAILSPGACSQVVFSCEELWNSLLTTGALCFPLPNLRCVWNAVTGGRLCVFPWEWGRSGAPRDIYCPHFCTAPALAVWRGSRLGSKQALTCHSSLGSIHCSSHFLVPSPLPSPWLKKPHTKKNLFQFYILWEN